MVVTFGISTALYIMKWLFIFLFTLTLSACSSQNKTKKEISNPVGKELLQKYRNNLFSIKGTNKFLIKNFLLYSYGNDWTKRIGRAYEADNNRLITFVIDCNDSKIIKQKYIIIDKNIHKDIEQLLIGGINIDVDDKYFVEEPKAISDSETGYNIICIPNSDVEFKKITQEN
ncbi:hypothetical protein NIES2111_44010 [Nostoc sp. NIES-2111]|nr:hypothetical protein NIES2111_44010 [Nostoc sp. NIES-2111]